MTIAHAPGRFEPRRSFSCMQRSAQPRNGAVPHSSDAACRSTWRKSESADFASPAPSRAAGAQGQASEASLDLSIGNFGTRRNAHRTEAKEKGHADCSLLALVITVITTAMQKIIDQTVFEGKLANFVRARATYTSNGHLEISVTRPVIWHEDSTLPRPLDPYEPTPDELARQEAERADRSAKRGARLAKQRCRLRCKTIGADILLTLTYRENQQDLALCKAHLKEFVRRVTRVWPEFRCVCGFEQQKRGAWHVHIATERLPAAFKRAGVKVKSFDLLRHVWRAVCGPAQGNVDVQKKKRNSHKSPARIAAYLSKYITKNFAEGEKWSNRWTSFGDYDKPKKAEWGTWPDMRTAIEFCYGSVSGLQTIAYASFDRFNDVFFLAAEPRQGAPDALLR